MSDAANRRRSVILNRRFASLNRRMQAMSDDIEAKMQALRDLHTELQAAVTRLEGEVADHLNKE